MASKEEILLFYMYISKGRKLNVIRPGVYILKLKTRLGEPLTTV